MVKISIVGAGGWGKNLIRNYHQIKTADLRYVCDLDSAKRKKVATQYPDVQTVSDFDELLAASDVDAIVIATTAPSHHRLAKQALLAGKDVYVEKPFTLNTQDAKELVSIANAHDRVLMVGHLLEYHPIVTELKRLMQTGELGRMLYLYSQRLNLGTVRQDENALWNFAPHDISVMLFLVDSPVVDVSARGQSYLKQGVEDVVFLTLKFADGTIGNVHVSWLDPHKVRRLTIVGSKKMAVFDDLETNEKLRIYDKGAQFSDDYDTFAEYVGLRFGDITIPHISVGEPLKIECQHFLDCVKNRSNPVSDGEDGLRVVKVLEAAQRSLEQGGTPITLA